MFQAVVKFRNVVINNPLISSFIFAHVLFATFLGRLFAFGPDEGSYIYTFNNWYASSPDANPQYQSG